MMLEMAGVRFSDLLVITTLALLCRSTKCNPLNNKPVIGIVAQRSSDSMMQYGNEYIDSTYVKYLEMAGASVVTVLGNQPKHYYVELFKRVNGILLPGGGIDLMTSPYARSSRILYSLAQNANDKGDYFPFWGTCQGFEMMATMTANKDVMEHTDSENISLPLHLTPLYKKSRLLGNAPKNILYYLTHENVTANFHHNCLSTEMYKQEPSLNEFFRVMSVNKGRKGKEYVSTMEAIHYPFYAVQWHPEKNIFNRKLHQDISHTFHAVRVAQYFADFFVNEARKNFHKFAPEEERSQAVVENDSKVFIPKNYIEEYFYNVTESQS